MRLVTRFVSKISNGTIFGSSKVGRALGLVLSLAVLGGFLYLMSI